MRKSIFERLEQNYSNPLDEYLKISSFVNGKECYYSSTISSCFSNLFPFCKVFRKHYSDYNDCIRDNIGILANYYYPIGNDNYDGLSIETKEEICDSFLTYIEIVSYMLCVFRKYAPSVFGTAHIDKTILDQLEEMIDNSLKSINYVIDEKSTDYVRIRKIDPVSECVAEQSATNMKTAILNYLSIKSRDVEGKEKALHDIIDLLEPIFKKFNSVSIINVAREFAQIIRHPEIKKEQQEYKWFVSNKSEYLDQLFTLCVFSQQYALSKEIADSFIDKKKTSIQNKE